MKEAAIKKHWQETLSPEYCPVIELALRVGQFQKEQFRTGDLQIATKSTQADLVTRVDLACDEMISDALAKLFPQDNRMAEESGESLGVTVKDTRGEERNREPQVEMQGEMQGKAKVAAEEDTLVQATWIIDPLDGTTNFAVGLPIFAVSIARYRGAVPLFGVVYVPMVGDLFYAEAGKGAYMNGCRCTASEQTVMRQSVLATGFPYDRATARNCNAENMAKMIPRVRGVRRMGAAAYDLCLVAAGVFDAFWELRLAPWDFAAARLMIEEAGGVFNFTTEGQQSNVVCGSAALVAEIESIVDMKN